MSTHGTATPASSGVLPVPRRLHLQYATPTTGPFISKRLHLVLGADLYPVTAQEIAPSASRP
eukprot:364839-Chlamydomonas_euryale.AAC.7